MLKKPQRKTPPRPAKPSRVPKDILGVVPTDNAEQDSAAEMDGLRNVLRERDQDFQAAFIAETSVDFYVTAVFPDRASRDRFLAGLPRDVKRVQLDASYPEFVDGIALAGACGISIPRPAKKRLRYQVSRRLAGMV